MVVRRENIFVPLYTSALQMPTSDYGIHKELVPIVQAGIFLAILILAVFARVSDMKAADRVQRVAHKKCVHLCRTRVLVCGLVRACAFIGQKRCAVLRFVDARLHTC